MYSYFIRNTIHDIIFCNDPKEQNKNMDAILFTKIFAKELPNIERHLESLLQLLPTNIHEIVEHTSKAGGKRLRPLLTLLSAQLFGKTDNNIYPLASCLEMLHLASLLHDDVIDNASTRRKQVTAHTVYGNTMTILAGDALLAFACERISQLNVPELVSAYSKALLQTANGELEEIKMQGSLEHGLDVYYSIIRGKTAYLLRSASEIGALYMQKVMKYPVSDEEVQAIAQYGEEIGMAFQLIDDALDFAPEKQIGKPQGGDIKEGKATLPILMYYQSLPTEEARIFKEKFAQTKTSNPFTSDEIKEISEKIRANSYDSLAREKALEHLEKAKECLNAFPRSNAKDCLLSALTYLSTRNT